MAPFKLNVKLLLPDADATIVPLLLVGEVVAVIVPATMIVLLAQGFAGATTPSSLPHEIIINVAMKNRVQRVSVSFFINNFYIIKITLKKISFY